MARPGDGADAMTAENHALLCVGAVCFGRLHR